MLLQWARTVLPSVEWRHTSLIQGKTCVARVCDTLMVADCAKSSRLNSGSHVVAVVVRA